MAEEEYEERWIAAAGDNEYELDKKQAQVLSRAISQGRGIVQFKDFIINIPFLKEFYLVSRFLRAEKIEGDQGFSPRIIAPETPPTKEEIEKIEAYRILQIERSKVIARGQLPSRELAKIPRITKEEFEKKRREALEKLRNL